MFKISQYHISYKNTTIIPLHYILYIIKIYNKIVFFITFKLCFTLSLKTLSTARPLVDCVNLAANLGGSVHSKTVCVSVCVSVWRLDDVFDITNNLQLKKDLVNPSHVKFGLYHTIAVA